MFPQRLIRKAWVPFLDGPWLWLWTWFCPLLCALVLARRRPGLTVTTVTTVTEPVRVGRPR